MSVPIKEFLNHLFNEQKNWQLRLLNAWPNIVGLIKTHVELLKIYDDTLVIGVLDSCWLQELYLFSPLLLQKINEHLDKPRIKKLRFKAIGTDNKKIKKNSQEYITISKQPLVLTSTQKEALAGIEDEQLRDALKNYLIRAYNTEQK